MTTTQIAVTALGAVAIVWVLWYFLFSRGEAVAAPTTARRGARRRKSATSEPTSSVPYSAYTVPISAAAIVQPQTTGPVVKASA